MPSAWFEQDLDPMSGNKATRADKSNEPADHPSNLGMISRDLQRLVAILEKDAAKRSRLD